MASTCQDVSESPVEKEVGRRERASERERERRVPPGLTTLLTHWGLAPCQLLHCGRLSQDAHTYTYAGDEDILGLRAHMCVVVRAKKGKGRGEKKNPKIFVCVCFPFSLASLNFAFPSAFLALLPERTGNDDDQRFSNS